MITIDLSNCRYEVLRLCAEHLKLEEVNSENSAAPSNAWIIWTDVSVAPERIMKLKYYQKINHFPGMIAICRKVPLARNLNRMSKIFEEDYKFFPMTWILPNDANIFKKSKFPEGTTFIVKPNAGCQGRGIFLTKDKDAVQNSGDCVVQVYIERPLLIDDFKFDLRVYVLVKSVDPLRIFIYQDGLVRICTIPYKKPTQRNISKTCMHLTNYAVNKQNDKFQNSDVHDLDDNAEEKMFSSGSKRDFQFFNQFISEKFGSRLEGLNAKDDPVVATLWHRIECLIIKTILSIQPQLRTTYRSCATSEAHSSFNCFEILGYDILIDEDLNPWLIEVNHSPSFNIDAAIDKHIKFNMITEAIQLLCINKKLKKTYEQFEKMQTKERLGTNELNKLQVEELEQMETLENHEKKEQKVLSKFKLIYPTENEEDDCKFNSILEQAEKFATQTLDSHIQRLYNSAKKEKENVEELDDDALPPIRKEALQKLSKTSTLLRKKKSLTVIEAVAGPKQGEDGDTLTPSFTYVKKKVPVREVKSIPRITLEFFPCISSFRSQRRCFSVYMKLQKKHSVVKPSTASQHTSEVKKTHSLLADISTTLKYNEIVSKNNRAMPPVDDLIVQEKQFSALPKWQELCYELNKHTKDVAVKDILEGEDSNTVQLNYDALIPNRINKNFLQRLEQWKKEYNLESIPTEQILKCFISTDQLSHLLLETPLLTSGNNSSSEPLNSKASFPLQQVLWHSNRELVFEGAPLLNLILTMYLIRESNGASAGTLSHFRSYLTHPGTIKYVCENSLAIFEDSANKIFEFSSLGNQEDDSIYAKKEILIQGFNLEDTFVALVATVKRFLGMQKTIDFVNQFFLPQALLYISSSVSKLNSKDSQSLINNLNSLDTKVLVVDFEAEVSKLVQQKYFCKPIYKILQKQKTADNQGYHIVMGLYARDQLLVTAMGTTEQEARDAVNEYAFDKFKN